DHDSPEIKRRGFSCSAVKHGRGRGMAEWSDWGVDPRGSALLSGRSLALRTEVAMGGEATVQHGDRGELVSTMQSKLGDKGYGPQGVDGDFGDHTLAAVKAFQTDKGLQVDGVCGNQTWGALQGDFSLPPGRTEHGGGGGGSIELSVGLDGGRVDD